MKKALSEDAVTSSVESTSAEISAKAPVVTSEQTSNVASTSEEVKAAVASISAEASAAVATISAEVAAAVASISQEASAAVASISAVMASTGETNRNRAPWSSAEEEEEEAWTQMPSTSAPTRYSVPWSADLAKKKTETLPSEQNPKKQKMNLKKQPEPSTSRMPVPAIINRVDYAVPPNVQQPYPKLPFSESVVSEPHWKKKPPHPILTIENIHSIPHAFCVQWTMNIDESYADIAYYNFYVYINIVDGPHTQRWIEFGCINALTLPMKATIGDFVCGVQYFISIRAIDIYGRTGPFGVPKMAYLEKEI